MLMPIGVILITLDILHFFWKATINNELFGARLNPFMYYSIHGNISCSKSRSDQSGKLDWQDNLWYQLPILLMCIDK